MPRNLADDYDRAIIRTPRGEPNLFDLAVLTKRVGQALASIVQRRVAGSDRSKKEGFVVCRSISEARRKLSSKHFDEGIRIFAAENGGRETGPMLMMKMADLLDMLEEGKETAVSGRRSGSERGPARCGETHSSWRTTQ